MKKRLEQKEVFKLFGKFISESSSGKRLKKDGTRIRKATIENYQYVKQLLVEFCTTRNFGLHIMLVNRISHRDFEVTKNYWRKFYIGFTDFLYKDKDYYDNYVGLVIKTVRSFFNYLKDELNHDLGSFHYSFYVPQEEIPIIALSPQQLNYLIYNRELDENLPPHLLRIKHRFVFGCTVLLRQGDISDLTVANLYREGSATYLRVRSGKTDTFTSVKLPDYAVDIIEKYKTRKGKLFPELCKDRFNKCLKELGAHLKYEEPVIKIRSKRGQKCVIYKDPNKKTHHTLGDLLTTHTMRRTGITTMLRMGTPDYMVRKISGHAPNSKEFFRYVQLAQNFLDEKTDEAFEKLKQAV
jgi:integrase